VVERKWSLTIRALFNSRHANIKQLIDLRTYSSYFKAFIDVAPVRRAPRRRAAANSKLDLETHTQDEIDKAFELRLQRMKKSGVFGDNLEIQAFAREFGVDVKIYQRDYAYVICADNVSGNAGKHNKDRKVVHIAYHVSSSGLQCRAGFPDSFHGLDPARDTSFVGSVIAHGCVESIDVGALFVNPESGRSSYWSSSCVSLSGIIYRFGRRERNVD